VNENDDHTPLIYRVIGQMGLSADEADEAFSEGLVSLASAQLSYDPQKAVPIASWLAMNIRWSLSNWVKKERIRRSRSFRLEEIPEPTETRLSTLVEYSQVIAQVKSLLTDEEQLVILASACGFLGRELARHLGRSEAYVSEVKWQARQKLINELKVGGIDG